MKFHSNLSSQGEIRHEKVRISSRKRLWKPVLELISIHKTHFHVKRGNKISKDITKSKIISRFRVKTSAWLYPNRLAWKVLADSPRAPAGRKFFLKQAGRSHAHFRSYIERVKWLRPTFIPNLQDFFKSFLKNLFK